MRLLKAYSGSIFIVLLFIFILCPEAYSLDGFEDVRCGGDIPAALMGKHVPNNEPVVATERRHKDLGLKDLGADGDVGEPITISWRICGSEYMVLLYKTDVVRDVIQIPPHSNRTPEFQGSCQTADNVTTGDIIAILDNGIGYRRGNVSVGPQTLLPARMAWKIDEKKWKFVKLPAKGLHCQASGIITLDGGF